MAPLVREKNVKRTIRRSKSDGRCQELAMSQNYEIGNSRHRKAYYVPPVYNEKLKAFKKELCRECHLWEERSPSHSPSQARGGQNLFPPSVEGTS